MRLITINFCTALIFINACYLGIERLTFDLLIQHALEDKNKQKNISYTF